MLAFLTVTFPKCAVLTSFGSTACSGEKTITIGKGLSSSATCSSASNAITIKNVYADYTASNGTQIEFSVTLSAAQTCADTDYVVITSNEGHKSKLLEMATVSLCKSLS